MKFEHLCRRNSLKVQIPFDIKNMSYWMSRDKTTMSKKNSDYHCTRGRITFLEHLLYKNKHISKMERSLYFFTYD